MPPPVDMIIRINKRNQRPNNEIQNQNELKDKNVIKKIGRAHV